MTVVEQIFTNKLITTPALAWITAQVLKTLLDGIRNHHFNPHLLFGTGGMPSAHSALVCGLAAAAGRTQGLNSPAFAITVALAAIVMYDAAGVRQAVDKQSEILTHLLSHVPKTPEEFDRFLESLVGHTRVQVLAGALLGILVGALWV
jgi:acid phosphatase family membrane protein YuiD